MCVCKYVCVSIVCTVSNIGECYEVCILHGVYGLGAIFTAESVPYGVQYVQGGFLISCRDGKGYCGLVACLQTASKPQVSNEIPLDKCKNA